MTDLQTEPKIPVEYYWFLMDLGLYESAEFKYFDFIYFYNNLDAALNRK